MGSVLRMVFDGGRAFTEAARLRLPGNDGPIRPSLLSDGGPGFGAFSQPPKRKPRIVVPTDHFASRVSSGTRKSIFNLVTGLSDEFRFEVHCRDSGSAPADRPVTVGASEIYYHDAGDLGWRDMRRWVDGADLIYLNSFFSPTFSLKMATLRRASRTLQSIPMLIAPRGEIFHETLNIKLMKKSAMLPVMRLANLYGDACWHASTSQEVEAIARMAHRLAQPAPKIFSACDVAARDGRSNVPPPRAVPHVLFLARICVKKNLDFALKVLEKVNSPVQFDIAGGVEDRAHLSRCQKLIARLPRQHRVRFIGPVDPTDVGPLLSRYDLYFLPTRSENFGHSIQEALAAGVPVLISDRTPWRALHPLGAGWDLPLEEELFVHAMEEFCAMEYRKRVAMRAAARFVSMRFAPEQALAEHRRMFRALLTPHP